MKIKQLKWNQIDDYEWSAEALGGCYVIVQYGQKYGVRWALGNTFRWLSCRDKAYQAIEEAKQVAQEDLEKVVNESLSENNDQEELAQLQRVTARMASDLGLVCELLGGKGYGGEHAPTMVRKALEENKLKKVVL